MNKKMEDVPETEATPEPETAAQEETHEPEEEPSPATPAPVPLSVPEVTPVKPKPKRGRPVGSTNRNTYQILAERLDQVDAVLAERQDERC